MRIVKLEAENIKALRAVEITPDGHLVEITGKNAAGKSSVLDSIWWALAGASAVDPVPIRTGETEARIRLDLGEIVVTRFFTEREVGDTATRLTVETAEGARFPSPQALLDGLLGALAFDPLAFSRLPAREQYDQISGMVGLDFGPDEVRNRSDYDLRTEWNRRGKANRAAADAINAPAEDGAEPVSVGDIARRIRDTEAANRELENERRRRETIDRAIKHSRNEAVERQAAADRVQRVADDRAADLERQARELRESAAVEVDSHRMQAKHLRDRADANSAELVALDVVPADTDTSALQAEIEGAEAVNAAIARRERKAKLADEAKGAEAESKRLTDAIAARKADMLKRLEAADMPVDGLGMADGAVTLHGRPLVQASDAEKLDVSCAIAMRQNARLKVLRIRDGSLLDAESKARIAAKAAEHGYQIWMECVDSSGKIGIVIEAGEVWNAVPV